MSITRFLALTLILLCGVNIYASDSIAVSNEQDSTQGYIEGNMFFPGKPSKPLVNNAENVNAVQSIDTTWKSYIHKSTQEQNSNLVRYSMQQQESNKGLRHFFGVGMIGAGIVSEIITIDDASGSDSYTISGQTITNNHKWNKSHTIFTLLSIGLIFCGACQFTF